MTGLRDLNREEWADKPYLIELRGGRMDGDRFRRSQLSPVWVVPEVPPKSLTTDPDEDFWPNTVPVGVYRETGAVTDDGAHVYQFDGYR